MQKQRLTLAREVRGMSRSDLAAATGISVVSIGFYERGELDPGTSALVKLCRALDVSADFLLGLTDDYHELLPREEAPKEKPQPPITAMHLIEDVLDTLVEVGNGVTDDMLHEAADNLFTARDILNGKTATEKQNSEVDGPQDPPKYSDVTIHLPKFEPMSRFYEPRPEMNITIAGHVILELAKRLKTDPGTAITVGPGGEAHG